MFQREVQSHALCPVHVSIVVCCLLSRSLFCCYATTNGIALLQLNTLYTLYAILWKHFMLLETQFPSSDPKTLNLAFSFGVTNFMSEFEQPNDEMSKGQVWSPGLGTCEPIIMVMTAVPRV